MKTKIALLSVCFLLLAFHASSTAAVKSSCLICHTSDSIMKSLYKPPAMGSAEGEG